MKTEHYSANLTVEQLLMMVVIMMTMLIMAMVMVMRHRMILMIHLWRRGMVYSIDGGADWSNVFLPRVVHPLPCTYQLQSDQMPLGSVGGRTV